jgi:hypothetical protein
MLLAANYPRLREKKLTSSSQGQVVAVVAIAIYFGISVIPPLLGTAVKQDSQEEDVQP